MSKYQLGKNAVLYLASAVFTAADGAAVTAATLTAIPIVKDVTIDESDELADATTRGDGGFKTNAPVLTDLSIETTLVFHATDTQLATLRTAKTAKAEIGLAALTGPKDVAGNQGPVGNWIIERWGSEQALGDIVKIPVTFRPSSFMQIHVVAGS